MGCEALEPYESKGSRTVLGRGEQGNLFSLFDFISFLSLLIRMHILKQLQETELIKTCSLERLFLELEKVRWVVLPENKFLITEIGKKQRHLLDTLNIAPEVRNYVRT